MTQLKELRQQGKAQGIKGYSVMNKDNLILALQGKPVSKKLRKNQVSVGTQTYFEMCESCSLKKFVMYLKFKADVEMRKTLYDDDMEIDIDNGKICGYEIDYSRY